MTAPRTSIAGVRRVWQRRGFTVHLQTDPAGKTWAPHTHKVDEIVRAVQGHVEIIVGTRKKRIPKHSDIIVPKRTVHWIQTPGKHSSYYYGFRNRPKK